jgi:hypothetical protein
VLAGGRVLTGVSVPRAIYASLPDGAPGIARSWPMAGPFMIQRRQRAMMTVQGALAATSAATEPRKSRDNPRLSPVPITMWSI